ncbi:acyl-homoserine-lactone acylase [Herbihabitans rhizosphaerae]|uniref:Acyl-homoserine-lactone acylase n=1 Tax=Herbihabitans rhizosphaerae TaxID=1872711 RepID=A0A4Q7KW40_9PSEU|nr:penicillin acylase family protein [Herbihabitans rhizosphaerae]RZS41269.1 acyl-homoserine-lactone acylase [Herbihabitans rhizosphaerae]
MGHKGFRWRLALTGALTATVAAAAPAVAAEPSTVDGHGLSALIRTTEYGLPHIVARDYAGAGFGQGYVAARDHQCVIGEGMVSLAGERSRYFGPEGSPTNTLVRARTNLSSDAYFRALEDNVRRLVDAPAPLGPQQGVRDMVRGYALGYNKFLGERQHTSCDGAPWLRPMTELDVYRRAYAWGLAFGWSSTPDQFASGPGAAGSAPADRPMSGPGSNSIAFGRNATANGRGISIGNPHLPWVGDYLWHQTHVTIPGRLNVAGAGFVGMPTIALGHNETMAWSGTMVDAVRPFTLFELTLVPGSPTTYLVDGRPEPMRRRDIGVDVRRPDENVGRETRTQWWTRYGPVVTGAHGIDTPWTAERAFAMADPNAGNLRLLNSLFEIGHARDARQVHDAIRRTQGLSLFNLLATDSHGATLYSGATVVPNVPDAHAARCNTALGQETFAADGIAVLDGSRTGCAWRTDADAIQPGTFGPANLPILERSDYVANSNESYWLTNASAPMPKHARILGTAEETRNVRTRDTLVEIRDQLAKEPFTGDGARNLLLSNRSHAAELTIPGLLRLCPSLGEDLREACDALARWDLKSNVDSRGTVLFNRFWTKVDVLPEAQLWRNPYLPSDPVNTPNTLDITNPAIATAFADAVKELRAANIRPDAPLGEHLATERGGRRFPLAGAPGETGTFNVINARWDPARGYVGVGEPGANGSSYLHVISFGESRCPDARTLTVYSQSSDPLSPHHADQTDLLARKEMVRTRFCERDIMTAPDLRIEHIHG